jgi:hypothetical protein
MADILLGLLAIFAGGAMLLAGQFVLRLVIPIWGFFAGFAFGAGLVAGFADEHFLGSVLGWVLGLVFALVFAVLAYLYYYVAILIAMGAFGFAIADSTDAQALAKWATAWNDLLPMDVRPAVNDEGRRGAPRGVACDAVLRPGEGPILRQQRHAAAYQQHRNESPPPRQPGSLSRIERRSNAIR